MGFEGLLSQLKSAAQEVAAIVAQPPESCTLCGKPWTPGPQGQLHCVFDGTIWDGKAMGRGQ